MVLLKDNDNNNNKPIITYYIITISIIVFLIQLTLPGNTSGELYYTFGLIPSKLLGKVFPEQLNKINPYLTFFTSIFLHVGFLHLLFNMSYLWIFGRKVEYKIGKLKFAISYFVYAIITGIVQILFGFSYNLPMIGADGAISGLLGAYIIEYPKKTKSYYFIAFWFIFQFIVDQARYNLNGEIDYGVKMYTFIFAAFITFAFKRLTYPQK